MKFPSTLGLTPYVASPARCLASPTSNDGLQLHQPLTSRSTEQIVAELGWTRLIIQKVLGITPTTMRAPYGDIDDRVRAIALAMGMVPIQWTRAPSGFTFDTNGSCLLPPSCSTRANAASNH